MRIDRKSRPWILVCLLIFLAGTGLFIWNLRHTPGRPSGGSWTGLGFAAAGSLAMIIATLLALRKRTRSVRLGRVYAWMQAHVWLGLLSYPLIIYHAGGLAWGGPLTQALMWIFTLVIVSGVAGLILQQIIPTKLTREVSAETIFAQIHHVLMEIREEAALVARPILAERESGNDEIPEEPSTDAVAIAARKKSVVVDPFESFYTGQIVPFLDVKFHPRSTLASAYLAQEAFADWRSRLPEPLHPAVSRLQSLVDERRQLARQRRLHNWLHGWLLLHVPFSYLLIVLGVIHAIYAFKYTTPMR